MAYVHPDPDSLVGTPKAGDGQCVALIKLHVPGLKGVPTSAWCQGKNVIEALSEIQRGTAIATFENGRYPNRLHGNHAAIVLSVMPSGIWVLDQWPHDRVRQTIEPRLIRVPPRWRQRDHQQRWISPSDNALAFHVIERCKR